jgi:hypothetical protein
MKLKGAKVPDVGKIIPVIYIIGFILILIIVYKLLSSIGIIKTPKKKRELAAQAVAVEALRTDDYFDPAYYRNKKFKSIGMNAANLYAQYVRKAVRGAGTDEELIFTTFGKLYNKCNVSEVAERYTMQYKRDMQTDLLNDLTKKEAAALMSIIDNLPNT